MDAIFDGFANETLSVMEKRDQITKALSMIFPNGEEPMQPVM